jgi:hypothetical protein
MKFYFPRVLLIFKALHVKNFPFTAHLLPTCAVANSNRGIPNSMCVALVSVQVCNEILFSRGFVDFQGFVL